MFQAAAVHGFTLESADASSAFLQAEGDLEGHNLFVRPTDEVAAMLGLMIRHKDSVAKIMKSFYGLTNAP